MAYQCFNLCFFDLVSESKLFKHLMIIRGLFVIFLCKAFSFLSINFLDGRTSKQKESGSLMISLICWAISKLLLKSLSHFMCLAIKPQNYQN